MLFNSKIYNLIYYILQFLQAPFQEARDISKKSCLPEARAVSKKLYTTLKKLELCKKLQLFKKLELCKKNSYPRS